MVFVPVKFSQLVECLTKWLNIFIFSWNSQNSTSCFFWKMARFLYIGFYHVAKNVKISLKSLCLVYSQILSNFLLNDHQLGYITKKFIDYLNCINKNILFKIIFITNNNNNNNNNNNKLVLSIVKPKDGFQRRIECARGLSCMVASWLRSGICLAPESGIGERETESVQSWKARARPLRARALEWRADGDCSDKVCRVAVALNERLTIQLFLLTRPTGGLYMFAVVFCCVFFDG